MAAQYHRPSRVLTRKYAGDESSPNRLECRCGILGIFVGPAITTASKEIASRRQCQQGINPNVFRRGASPDLNSLLRICTTKGRRDENGESVTKSFPFTR